MRRSFPGQFFVTSYIIISELRPVVDLERNPYSKPPGFFNFDTQVSKSLQYSDKNKVSVLRKYEMCS